MCENRGGELPPKLDHSMRHLFGSFFSPPLSMCCVSPGPVPVAMWARWCLNCSYALAGDRAREAAPGCAGSVPAAGSVLWRRSGPITVGLMVLNSGVVVGCSCAGVAVSVCVARVAGTG